MSTPASPLDEYSCSYFDDGFSKRTGNDSWNRNDQVGEDYAAKIIAAFVVGVGAVILLIVSGIVGNVVIAMAAIPVIGVSTLLAISAHSDRRANVMAPVYATSAAISSQVRTPPVLDPYEMFPDGASDFESAHPLIKEEVLSLDTSVMTLTRDTYGGQNNTIGKDVSEDEERGWRVLVVSTGETISAVARTKLPTLVELVERYPRRIRSCVVSVLPPRTMIPQHVGYYKGIFRLMLPVVVPRDRENCYICVNDDKLVWEEGKVVAFDDCYPHKVFNNTDEVRIVIYMDIVREGLGSVLDNVNEWMIKQMQESDLAREEVLKTEKLIDLI